MSKIKSSCLFRTISLILILTFISFDISYAYPPEHDAGNSTLATPSVLQQVLVSEHAARFQQSVFSQGALIASVYDIGEYFFGNADKGIGSLPSKYAEGAINMDFGKHLSGANTEILNIVPVEYIKQTSPEKLKSVLEEIGFKGTLPDEGVVFILYKKDDKKFLVQIAKKGEVRPENLPGYEWVVSDKYVVKYMPEDYAGEDHRLSITEPIAEIEAPANRTEETVVPASQAIVSQVNAHTSIKTQNIALENVATSVSAKEMLISYENIWEDFRRLTDYPDPKKLADIYKGYEAVLNNTRRPGRTDILSTTFELPKGEVSDAFERLTDEVIKVLPKGAVYHKIDPSTYHISVTPIQNLPFDVLGKKLTDNERRAVEEAVAKISSEQLPYRVKFLGLCFGTDGGVIAVFEDESLKTKSLRGKLITECNKVCDNKVSVKPKPLIHITLLRIFSKVAGRDLEKFKARAEELKDLSGLGLSMDLNKLGFNHEVRWMHTELDYSKSYPLGHKTELASTGQGI
ncbi:MAG: hypothetical protein Q8O01_04195, partial [Candidatus Omnitrophota bacterium]|nr:hypothetical protein [Candidatus Omnitrophota bacterium]